MSVETQTIETWLYDQLSTIIALSSPSHDTNPRVFAGQAPQETVYPLVLFSLQSAIDINSLGARGSGRALYQVKAVSEGESFPKDLADSIDTLLDNVQDTQDGLMLRWQRVQTIEYTETRLGKRYNHLGGIYRCFAG